MTSPARRRVAVWFVAASVVAAANWASWPRPGRAAEPEAGGADAKAPAEPAVVVRVYNVADLVAPIPDFDEAPDLAIDGGRRSSGGGSGGGSGTGGQPGGLFANNARPDTGKDTQLDELIKLVQRSVQPDTWRETGGMTGSIAAAGGGRIAVSHTAAAHEQVRDLLAGLRKSAAPPIRVRAHWVVADRVALEKVLAPAVAMTGANPATAAATRPAGLLAASAADLARVPGVLADARGELVCTSGQRVWVEATGTRGYVSGATGDGSGGDSLTLSNLTNGLVLDFVATLSDDRQTAVVTVRSQWTDVGTESTLVPLPASRPAAGAPPAVPGGTTFEMPKGRFSQLQTTARVPTGRMVLVGGMTVDPATALRLAATRPADGASPVGRTPAPQLYLFVEVTAD